jgi:hypothetical protein
MREAMAVIKAEREETARFVDGGKASAGSSTFSEEAKHVPPKIVWGGLVKANQFEVIVQEHNHKLHREMEEAVALKAVGKEKAKTFKLPSPKEPGLADTKEPLGSRRDPEKKPWSPKLTGAGLSEALRRADGRRPSNGSSGGGAIGDSGGAATGFAPGMRKRPSFRMQDRMSAMGSGFENEGEPLKPREFEVGQRVEANYGGAGPHQCLSPCHLYVFLALAFLPQSM